MAAARRQPRIVTGEAHTRRADAERAAAAVQRTFAAVQEATCSPN